MVEAMRWDDVRLFLALFREQTLAAAGERLSLDASTLSRRLVGLESALDVHLFDRTREGLVATAAARRLLPAAEEMERALLRFSETAEGFERTIEGTVRITTPPGVADTFLAPLLPALLKRHPRLRFEVDPGTGLADLGRREADLALRTIRPDGGDLVITRIAQSRWMPVASPDFARELGAVRDWNAVPWVTWENSFAQLPPSRWWSKFASKAELPVRSNSLAVQLVSVQHGVGVALAPEQYVKPWGLVPVRVHKSLKPTVDALPVDDLWLACARAVRQVPRIDAVWTHLVATFARDDRRRRAD